jgi:DNA polymerase V
MQMIGVIDCNNFFVSCERLFRPDLIGKPVMVLSSNDGCVVARSQEVKDIGIPMGIPVFQIKDIIKDRQIITFSSHFSLYRDISSRVFKVVKDLFPFMEQYSIDEAFFAFEMTSKEETEGYLLSVKSRIEQLVGIPVSIGLAQSKTQAKHANRLAKKGSGVCVLDGPAWSNLISDLPLRDIWGVGGRYARRFTEVKIITVADILNCSTQRLASLFGVVGTRLQAELGGHYVYKLGLNPEAKKSITSSRSFKTKVLSLAIIKDAVAYHIRHASSDLRRHKLLVSCLSVNISPGRHSDYFLHTVSKQINFTLPTNDLNELLKEALKAVDVIFKKDIPYKKAGISFSNLVPESAEQASLFAMADVKRNQIISGLVDNLNYRFGKETLIMGKQTKEADWVSRSEKLSPSYTTSWTDLATVNC